MMRFFKQKTQTITGAALLIGAASFLARILGMVRDRILAGTFGAGDALDTYYAAFRIPDLIYNLIILGTFSAAFIPIFMESKKKEEGWKFVSNLFNIFGVALVASAAVLFLFAAPLMKVIAPGFDAEKMRVTVILTRMLVISPIFLGLSGIFGGILQAHERFFINSLAPILYNVGIIFGALVLAPRYGVYGLAIGVVAGAFLHFLIQVPPALMLGFRWRFVFDVTDRAFRAMLSMSIPRVLSLAVSQIDFVIATVIASTLSSGSLAVFNLANNLQSFPLGIIGISFATAAFPKLSSLAADGSQEKFFSRLRATLRQVLFFITPAAVLLLTLRAQIVRVVLGTGRFDWQDTVATSDTLAFFALSLGAQALIPLFARSFYALKNSRTPMFAGAASVATDIIGNIILAPRYGVTGLAMAFTLASFVNLSILFISLKYEKLFFGREDLKFFTGVIAASIFMVIVIQEAKYLLAPLLNMQTGTGIFSQGAIAGIAGLGIYATICAVFKIPEIQFVRNLLAAGAREDNL
jgi:putative peptidoglycan lipid II flippase